MAGFAAATVAFIKLLQVVLASLQAYLGMGSFLCPVSTPIDTIISQGPYQFIVVGAGEAGMVLANRFAETDASVLMLEAGGCPPLESFLAGFFSVIPRSENDYAYDAYDDGYSCQNLKLEGLITAGKMLGGSSSLNHLICVTPNEDDYFSWGKAAKDDSWAFPAFAHSFAKWENIQHEGVLAQNKSIRGTNGPTKLTKQESLSNADLIAAFVEMGLPYKNDSDGQCVTDPLLFIGEGIRQSSIIGNKATGKKNVRFLTGATVTEIIFDGNTATGVKFTHNGNTYSISATNEVILSAGAIKSPQLLMVSGIGDRHKLAPFGINTIVDNKHVGQNLMDHTVTSIVIALDENTEPAPAANPTQWPAPLVAAYAGLTPDEESYSRQDIAVLFPPNSTGLLQISSFVFQYKDEITDAWYEYNINRNIIFEIINLMRPKSRGSVELQSKNIDVQPIIKMNHLNNSEDLDLLAKHAISFAKILDTEPMKKLNAEFADLGICECYDKFSFEYWKCYVLATSATLWHQCGTCAMGTVVDGNLSVIGVNNLSVIDASIFPYIVSGNPSATVRAVAEKGADIIKKKHGLLNK